MAPFDINLVYEQILAHRADQSKDGRWDEGARGDQGERLNYRFHVRSAVYAHRKICRAICA